MSRWHEQYVRLCRQSRLTATHLYFTRAYNEMQSQGSMTSQSQYLVISRFRAKLVPKWTKKEQTSHNIDLFLDSFVCLLFAVWCLLFVVCCFFCFLFVLCCLLFVCLLFVVCCLLFLVCCLLFACCLLFVVWLFFGAEMIQKWT